MSSPTVARIIDLPIPGTLADPKAAARVPTRTYLADLLPGHRVEYVARNEIVAPRYSVSSMSGTASLFFGALESAFTDHFGIALRPEVIWHFVMDAVATTVKRHPDVYGAWFSQDPRERTKVEVRDDTIAPGLVSSDWSRTIGLFDEAMRSVVPDGIMDVLIPELSTATAETRAASLVAFMDAASPFLSYSVRSMCGIPRVRLDGTADDWANVAMKASALRTVFSAHLDWYFDHLCPVLDIIAAQAAGAALDESFWRSIYRYEGGSGRSHIDGWGTALIAYVRQLERPDLAQDPKPAAHHDWTSDRKGLPHGSIPSHVSSVDFTWDHIGTKLPMKFVGGVLGVDIEDECTLVPRLSFAVVHPREQR